MMQKGMPPIYEEGLEELMRRNIKESRLSFTTDLRQGIKDAAAIFLALPTPENEDGSADLKYILSVAEQLGDILEDYTVIVNKSTVPVGTATKVRERIAHSAKVDFDVVSNPEFLREGQAVRDVAKPDRVVVGLSSERAKKVMRELYEPYVRNGNPIRFVSEESAELTKYGANGFLATKVSFINELALVAEAVGADIKDVVLGMGDDKRIGHEFMHPSTGWGGSCFPKDSRALIKIAEDAGVDFKIMKAADEANDRQRKIMADKVKKYFGGDIKGKKFALWGLAFKKDTDDVRESPALEILDELVAAGAEVFAYDPAAINNAKKQYEDNHLVTFVDNPYDGLDGAEALVIATDWEIFTNPDFKKIKSSMKSPLVFDGRLLWEPEHVRKSNFYYETIGRPVVNPNV